MIVLDTTVLVYAVGSEHPLRTPCRALVSSITRGELSATTTVEVIQEFVHVWARRRDRREAAERGRDYAELLAPLVVTDAEDLRTGLRLFESEHRLGAFDAVLASTALGLGADALVSADRAFADVDSLNHVVPDTDGVRRLLEL